MITVSQVKESLKNETFRLDNSQFTFQRTASFSFISFTENKNNVGRKMDKDLRYCVTYYIGGASNRWHWKGGFKTIGEAVKFAKTVYSAAEKVWNEDLEPSSLTCEIKYAYPASEIATKFGYKNGCAYILIPGQSIRYLFPCQSANSGADGVEDAYNFAMKEGIKIKKDSMAWLQRIIASGKKLKEITIDKGELFREAHKLARSARRPGCTYKEDFAAALRIVWTAAKSRASQALAA